MRAAYNTGRALKLNALTHINSFRRRLAEGILNEFVTNIACQILLFAGLRGSSLNSCVRQFGNRHCLTLSHVRVSDPHSERFKI